MDENLEKKEETPSSDEGKDPKAPSQDPVKEELEKIRKPKSEAEKASFSLKKTADRVRELGLDPKKILGLDETETDEEDKPVTLKMWKQLEAERSQKTALQLAEEIEDANVRELTKHYLTTRVVPSGNPTEDLRFALAAVSSVKNGQIAEELARKGKAKTHSSATSAPAKPAEDNFQPTEEELSFMRPPFNLSKEEIIKARGSK